MATKPTPPAEQATTAQLSIVEKLARKFGMMSGPFQRTLAKTIFPSEKDATPEQVAALCIVADQHGLNPWTKEIYAFPAKGGGIVPIVGVDGWYRMLNRDGSISGLQCEFHHHDPTDPTTLFSATARLWKKGWDHPLEVTEYLSECKRNSPPWNSQPHRMLRHRAIAQAARIACGFSGVYHEDEAISMADGDFVREARVVEATETVKPKESLADEVAKRVNLASDRVVEAAEFAAEKVEEKKGKKPAEDLFTEDIKDF